MLTPRPRTPLQYRKWLAGSYLPRLVASSVMHRRPIVDACGSKPESQLVEDLARINLLRPTEFCRVMTRFGSDKGRRWHNYTAIYAVLFAGYGRSARVFELGLGTNNPGLVSSMGSTGRPGASLRGWRELFPEGSIFGADIDRGILFQEPRIRTFYCDQLDQTAIAALWAEPALADGMDILIEDGLHTFEANLSFMAGSLEHVAPGGTYVVEDIESRALPAWRSMLRDLAARHPDFEFVLLELPNPANQQDNNLLVARRDR